MMYYLVTVIGGNIFVNSIVMGFGEMLAGVISGCLLRKFKDTRVFIGANLMTATFNTLFYYMPVGLLQYTCLIFTIIGMAT